MVKIPQRWLNTHSHADISQSTTHLWADAEQGVMGDHKLQRSLHTHLLNLNNASCRHVRQASLRQTSNTKNQYRYKRNGLSFQTGTTLQAPATTPSAQGNTLFDSLVIFRIVKQSSSSLFFLVWASLSQSCWFWLEQTFATITFAHLNCLVQLTDDEVVVFMFWSWAKRWHRRSELCDVPLLSWLSSVRKCSSLSTKQVLLCISTNSKVHVSVLKQHFSKAGIHLSFSFS